MSTNFIAERLKELRFKNQIKQSELAEKLGVSQAQVARYESYQNRPPFAIIKLMAEILGTTPEYLMGEVEDTNDIDSTEDKKMELAKRLKHWRTYRNMTQEKLAELSDMTRKAVSSYENARVFLSFDAAKKLGQALDISPMYLLCETDDPHEHRKQKQEGNVEVPPKQSDKKLPLYESASAGVGTEPLSEPIDFIPSIPGEKGDFWLTIRGDSMEPRLFDGDRVLVDKSSVIKNNDTVIAIVDGEVFCKVYYKAPDGHISLYSLAVKYDPIRQNGQIQFDVIGKVVGYYGKM